jgi:hypothetical protein
MASHGTSRAYLIARMRQTAGLEHLAAAVEAGKITAHAVGLELGWIQPRLIGGRRGSVNQAKRRRFVFQKLVREARSHGR